ncbi:MAG: hypothetical protein A2W25_02405 [candidate division Zixibacteria bacterium RBG_16_53_22]|nr:MAG: hypothetical protein A2W25_02405 [candidate division Zixibacteria bacterium RBG_16_53_22]
MDLDVKKKSVTANDVGSVGGASVFRWMFNPTYGAPDGLPDYWSPARDAYLRAQLTAPFHDFWVGAIGIAISKMASQGWDVEGKAPITRARAQSLLLEADSNQSWVAFLGSHLQDFISTDNGAFIEIVRASKGAGSRIIGLMHLDSLRITRTGDPNIPALYRDTKNAEHELKAHQILMLSDMPSSAETWYGVGLSAASRAWGAIKKLEAIERFIYEKVAGVRPKAVDLVGGVSENQLRQAVESAHEDNHSKGYVQYMGAVVVPTLSDIAITHTRINFAELPDGFDYKQQFDNCALLVANAIGLDIQDLQPLSGQRLGTAMQSEVLDAKSRGKGLSAWRQQITHALNQFVIAPTVTFAFSESDIRETEQRAKITETFANAMGTLVEKQILTPAQALQMLADEEIVPKEFVPDDTTPRESLQDSEKPEAEAEAQEEAPPDEPTEEATTVKEMRSQFADALKRFDAAIKHE